jgi:hypothetical protein
VGFLVFLVIFISSPFVFSKSNCVSDNHLVALGFVKHDSNEFEGIYKSIKSRLLDPKENIVYDFATRDFNPQLNIWQAITSWDDHDTYDLLMYGDILLITTFDTKEPLEVRWFDGVNKHFVYQRLTCANDYIPDATNTLF